MEMDPDESNSGQVAGNFNVLLHDGQNLMEDNGSEESKLNLDGEDMLKMDLDETNSNTDIPPMSLSLNWNNLGDRLFGSELGDNPAARDWDATVDIDPEVTDEMGRKNGDKLNGVRF
jgi:hypothetical protein